ncbi:NmrA family NAD(P)-binding protein [Bradyrhizobium sp. 156]|uniref:SDR family oxidoreductase n=1 Tax=Bradyrhizobium sp. 156 TaxID=2782630 RepID=UPI001FFAC469|nr:NmrA family NAD(P)-binding protein [Bradyrhizobium sp. 156]MCK1323583.1 NmrA family NAD(P)-binding protein [Bradyrhizobium sp. 156]
MAILVVGSTGKVGSLVVAALLARGADVRALTRDPSKASLPEGVSVVKGDLLDVDTMRQILADVTTLFLINPVARDEHTQALVTLGLARDANVKGVVYLSMLNADAFLDTPHSSAKYAAELMIEKYGIPATILRPTYFMQNDLLQKDALANGFYAMPLGRRGVAMIDARDLAEVAAFELIRRQNAPESLPLARIEVVGPDVMTGEDGAKIWSEVTGTEIVYAGDDLVALEKRIGSHSESWLAYDQALMFQGFHQDGMIPAEESVQTLMETLGRPLRTYRSFVIEQAAAWNM